MIFRIRKENAELVQLALEKRGLSSEIVECPWYLQELWTEDYPPDENMVGVEVKMSGKAFNRMLKKEGIV